MDSLGTFREASRGNHTNAILKVDFWRITHFKVVINLLRIFRCIFVNIIISYLYNKK